MISETTEEIKAEALLDELINDAQVHGELTEQILKELIFFDKTLWEWAQSMHIDIPKKPNTQDMQRIFADLTHNYQIASHYYTLASTVGAAVISGADSKKARVMTEIYDGYREKKERKPAVAAVERRAQVYLANTENARVIAKIVKDFWRDKKEMLTEVRKNMEQLSISIATELKHLQGGI